MCYIKFAVSKPGILSLVWDVWVESLYYACKEESDRFMRPDYGRTDHKASKGHKKNRRILQDMTSDVPAILGSGNRI